MKLKVAKLPRTYHKNGEMKELLLQFLSSGNECMEVEDDTQHYSDVESARNCFNGLIKRDSLNIIVSTRNGKLFFINPKIKMEQEAKQQKTTV